MRVQGAGPRLPQPLVPAEEGGSTCPCLGGGAACHRVPPGSPGVVALPAWLSAFRDQCAPRASPCPWAGLRPAGPSAHPPSFHPHPWVLSLAPRMCSNPQPRGVPGRAHRQACAHCGCESSCVTHPPPCPRTPARLPGGCFRFSNKGSVLCPLGSSDCRHIAAQPHLHQLGWTHAVHRPQRCPLPAVPRGRERAAHRSWRLQGLCTGRSALLPTSLKWLRGLGQPFPHGLGPRGGPGDVLDATGWSQGPSS